MPQTLEDAIQLNKPVAAARLLAEGADPNARAGNVWPLHHAAERGGAELVQALIAGGAGVNLTLDYSGTPLYAAARGPAGVAAIPLLPAHGADANAVEPRSGSTPLHNAAAAGNAAVTAMLPAAGARINAPDGAKFTPLFRAAGAEQRDMALLLLRLGAVLNLDVISLHNDLLEELHWLLTGQQSGDRVAGEAELEGHREVVLERAGGGRRHASSGAMGCYVLMAGPQCSVAGSGGAGARRAGALAGWDDPCGGIPRPRGRWGEPRASGCRGPSGRYHARGRGRWRGRGGAPGPAPAALSGTLAGGSALAQP